MNACLPVMPVLKGEDSYIALIAKAILSHPDQRCSLKEIYSFLLRNHPRLAEKSPQSWKNCVRHNLSLNACFVKVGRCKGEKGNYWAIHPANMMDFLSGDFRRRRAKSRVRMSSSSSSVQSPLQPTCGVLPCPYPMPGVYPVFQPVPFFAPLPLSSGQGLAQCIRQPSTEEVGHCDATMVSVLQSGYAWRSRPLREMEGDEINSFEKEKGTRDESDKEKKEVLFVGQRRLYDSFNPSRTSTPLKKTPSPPANKKLLIFSIDNILKHDPKSKPIVTQ